MKVKHSEPLRKIRNKYTIGYTEPRTIMGNKKQLLGLTGPKEKRHSK